MHSLALGNDGGEEDRVRFTRRYRALLSDLGLDGSRAFAEKSKQAESLAAELLAAADEIIGTDPRVVRV